ncbi:uncharacterized protein LOC143237232 [Tachypleus tridentatus]|uniref:uncharacterized protein LOC143237232 n=1 Tax=Tachypleus tridentatus TaxID=6853 RepID=UPI003FD12940
MTDRYDHPDSVNLPDNDEMANGNFSDVATSTDSHPDLSSGSHNSYSAVTEQELSQVEMFFRSQKTFVFVCPCLANLYFAKAGNEWETGQTGIPVLLFDRGETRARSKRRLKVVLAERGTGFILWHDVIDNLTNYRAQDSSFHTMFRSADHSQMVGLSFDSKTAASQFHEQVELLTSDPLNISLSIPKVKGKCTKKKPEKVKLPKKCDISLPCCFEHVTSIDIGDKEQFYTLASLVQAKSKKVFQQLVGD